MLSSGFGTWAAAWCGVVVPWLAAILVHLCANQLVAVAGARWLHGKHPAKREPLQDLGHKVLPHVRPSRALHALLEAWSIAPGVAAVAASCVAGWGAAGAGAATATGAAAAPCSAELFLRTHTLVLLARPLCFLGTLLPDASQVARRPPFWSIAGGVHDLLFSGHASSALCGVLALTWHRGSGGARPGWGAVAAWAACVTQSLLIVASRRHYTVDVVVAWLLCPALMHVVAAHHAHLA